MKCILLTVVMAAFWTIPCPALGQIHFSLQEYSRFLQDNLDLSSQDLLCRHAPAHSYYLGRESDASLSGISYLDSVILQYDLTESELDLLERNRFLVSERLSFNSFRGALNDVYEKDLPVFVTTDAILHALHYSYDRLLMELELDILKPTLAEFLDALYSAFPQLLAQYATDPRLKDPLADVDLFDGVENGTVT